MEIRLSFLPLNKWFILTVMVLFLMPLSSSPQSTTQTSFQPQKKVALVIGNGNYISSTLSNPENDARSMKVVLQSVGFTVMEYEDLNQNQMKKAIDDFGMKLKGNEVGLFFYAGHGIQSKGYNYLIPVDAQLKSDQQVEYDCVQADRVLALMEASGTKVNIVILDACRNNPFERSWTRSANGSGLAFMNAPRGSLIAYATSPGSTASDGSGNNGLYTSAILESIKIPDITILEMFQNVRNIVTQKSNNQQTPWESTSLTGNFYFSTGKIVQPEIQEKILVTPANETTSITLNDYIIDSRDKERYKTVKIGNQVWMAENLKTTKFNDGKAIPLVTDDKKWEALTTPAYCSYKNDVDTYIATYGNLYNWYSVNTGKLCPMDWHVPTDTDWTTLTTYLGGENIAGGKLKEEGTTHWRSPNTEATNESGFTALPSGCRVSHGTFLGMGSYGGWWSAAGGYSVYSWYRNMGYDYSSVHRSALRKQDGWSVRCIKDN
jgi:uncharacterized protein (TIGR02145 family)